MDRAGFFRRLEKGIYINDSIVFGMGGPWRLELWLTDQNLQVQDGLTWELEL